MSEEIPSKFVWTKMAVHAGEPLGNIIRRKLLELVSSQYRADKFANTFWWGVGDNKAPAICSHLANHEPQVLFSEMRSKPRQEDMKPPECVWTSYRIYDPEKNCEYGGKPRDIPGNVLIQTGKKEKYYALVCHDPRLYDLSEASSLYVANMINLNKGKKCGKPLGKSQTTCVVKYSKCGEVAEHPYLVMMRANLACPYFVELANPISLDDSQRRLLKEIGDEGKTVGEYLDVVRKIRR